MPKLILAQMSKLDEYDIIQAMKYYVLYAVALPESSNQVFKIKFLRFKIYLSENIDRTLKDWF